MLGTSTNEHLWGKPDKVISCPNLSNQKKEPGTQWQFKVLNWKLNIRARKPYLQRTKGCLCRPGSTNMCPEWRRAHTRVMKMMLYFIGKNHFEPLPFWYSVNTRSTILGWIILQDHMALNSEIGIGPLEKTGSWLFHTQNAEQRPCWETMPRISYCWLISMNPLTSPDRCYGKGARFTFNLVPNWREYRISTVVNMLEASWSLSVQLDRTVRKIWDSEICLLLWNGHRDDLSIG